MNGEIHKYPLFFSEVNKSLHLNLENGISESGRATLR